MIRLVNFIVKTIALLIGILMFWGFFAMCIIMWDKKFIDTWECNIKDIYRSKN